MKKIIGAVLLSVVFLLTGCRESDPTKEYADYFGTYYEVEYGSIDEDYRDRYEDVPTYDSSSPNKKYTLRSADTYEIEIDSISKKRGDIYKTETRKFPIRWEGNSFYYDEPLTLDNFKSFVKVYKKENGDLRISDDYYDNLFAFDSTEVVKTMDSYDIYDISEYFLSDLDLNEIRFYLLPDGKIARVSYDEEEDKTRVKYYEKQ